MAIKRRKYVSQATDHQYGFVVLSCGHTTTEQPTITSPIRKWFCCGELRRQKSGS